MARRTKADVERQASLRIFRIGGQWVYDLACTSLQIKRGEGGRYFVKAGDKEFLVRGGLAAGGSRREWAVQLENGDWCPCKGLLHALRIMINV